MLHLFFTITFVAEVIVCCWIVSKLKKLDEIVLEKNAQVLEYQPVLKSALTEVKANVNKSMLTLTSLVTFIGETKGECKKLFSKNFLSALGCLILKIPFKQIMSALDVILMVKRILKV